MQSLNDKQRATSLFFLGGILAAGAGLGYGIHQIFKVVGGSKSLVHHTLKKALWRRNPKTGVVEYRNEVVESPASLALQASQKLGRKNIIPLTTYTLATVIASEAGGGPSIAKAAIGHAIKNAARGKGVSIFKLIAPDGKYGSQQGRYAASGLPPTETDVKIAEAIEAGVIKDITKGAVQWDSPSAQAAMVARKIPGYSKTPEQVAESRRAEGKTAIYLPGVSPGYLRLWSPARGVAGEFAIENYDR